LIDYLWPPPQVINQDYSKQVALVQAAATYVKHVLMHSTLHEHVHLSACRCSLVLHAAAVNVEALQHAT
jgi:hypothetical protein